LGRLEKQEANLLYLLVAHELEFLYGGRSQHERLMPTLVVFLILA
jgi:hypothetical protein